jgi:Flp pilus assembly protein TadD
MLLTEALRVNPKNAAAHAMLGYVLDARDDRVNAAAHYERAIALGSNDAEIHLIYGMTLIEGDGDRRRARELFQRAAQLDPNDPRAWAGIGLTYVNESSGIDIGIAALEKSLALAPAQEDAAVNLIQLLAEAGRADDAQRVFDKHLAQSTNDEYLRIARDALEFAQVRAAEHLFDAGKEAQAIDAMRAILAKTQDGAMREHLSGVIAGYDEHVERERQSKAIAEVMAKANAGKTKEALALLDALIPSVTDEELRKQLMQMRKELARRRN